MKVESLDFMLLLNNYKPLQVRVAPIFTALLPPKYCRISHLKRAKRRSQMKRKKKLGIQL